MKNNSEKNSENNPENNLDKNSDNDISDRTSVGPGLVTPITRTHIIKFICRSLIFIYLLCDYLPDGHMDTPSFMAIPVVIVFVAEVISRFFPTVKLNSIGALKHLEKSYQEKEKGAAPHVEGVKGALIIAIIWIFYNGLLIGLTRAHILDQGIMILLSGFYAVCDMICVLFWCPLQLYFMKNRCCVTCRIYNWDYIMMVTPLIAINSIYSVIMVVAALALFLHWEINYKRHPERYAKNTNGCLDCKNCNEKICAFKVRKLH